MTLEIYKKILLSGERMAGQGQQDLAGLQASGATKPVDTDSVRNSRALPEADLCAPCGPYLKGPAPVSRTTSLTEKGPLRFWPSSHGAGTRARDAGAVRAELCAQFILTPSWAHGLVAPVQWHPPGAQR